MIRYLLLATLLLSGSLIYGAQENYVTGHKVDPMDKRITDWIGVVPEKENTEVYSNGEYIWKDAKGDNTGNGKYTSPQSKDVAKGDDLLEFRVTYDDKNVYFLIRTSTPNEWWAPYRIIGIDKDGARLGKQGNVVLAQGNPNEINSYNGTYIELRTDPKLACDYVIAVSSSYKGRIWDSNGRLVAKRDAEDNDTKGFDIADPLWSIVEVAVPIKLLGDPAGETWRFIVATCTQDQDFAREVYEEVSEWHGGGGEGKAGETGPDPDAYDLASPSKEIQEKELGSYKASGEPGDSGAFATIEKSYLTVRFADR